MFIVWGEHKKEKSLGYAADFCAMCRELRSFRIHRIGSASHVYGVSFGGGKLVGYSATCQSCGHKMEVDPTGYETLAKRRRTDIGDLERETFPGLREAYAERIALEQDLASGKVDMAPELRKDLIREPFTNLAPVVEERYGGSSHFDWKTTLMLIATLTLPATLGVISSNSDDSSLKSTLGSAALVTFVLGLVLTFALLFTEARRYVRRKILPRLARTLRSLKPKRARVYLFGSWARGEVRRSSDIDVAILPRRRLPEDLLPRLREALEESHVPYKVDLVNLGEAGASLKKRVLNEGIRWAG